MNYYTGLFGTARATTTIDRTLVEDSHLMTDSMNETLTKKLTLAELKNVVFCMGNNKAPGPDGYNSYFFKKAWPLIHSLLFEAVDSFFLNGKLLRQINNTFVTLIPKVANPMYIKDFRPIACCNTIYKVITKILAQRIQSMMPHLVLSNQSAFVTGRLMQHNILLSQELIRGYAQKNVSPRCLLKIDLQKAYDTIS